jgi:hypothetical protein
MMQKLPKAPLKAIYKTRFQLHIRKVASRKHYTIAFFFFFPKSRKARGREKKGKKKKKKGTLKEPETPNKKIKSSFGRYGINFFPLQLLPSIL